MRRIGAVWLCMFLVFSGAIIGLDTGKVIIERPIDEVDTLYTPHATIRINSDSDFDEAHGVVNWATGDGSQGNPWVIEGWDINGTSYGYCIYIGNTTEHFIVNNCLLHEASGNNAQFFWDAGCVIYRCANGTVHNNTASMNTEYGIDVRYSDNITIIKNNVTQNGDGINIEHSDYNNVTDNSVSSNDYFGIVVWWSDRNSINNNNISLNENGFYVGYSNNNSFNNISSWSNNNLGMGFSNSYHIELNNSKIYLNTWYGLYVVDSFFTTVLNSRFISNEEGIFVMDSDYFNVSYSNMSWNNNIGLRAWISDHLIISHCTAFSNSNGGINSDACFDVNILSSTSIENSYGVGCFSSTGSMFNCTISHNWNGVTLSGYNGNIIQDNVLHSNRNRGFSISSSDDNIIINNIIDSNVRGFNIQNSNNNYIYHNTIINNGIGASDNGLNYWNETYPIGGNYWSDYVGVDLNSTPAQNVPPPDGFGDTPYTGIIGGGNVDNYPLMEPYELTESTISLLTGWNLISIPLYQLNNSINNVLSDITGKWDYIQVYNALDPDPWKTYATFKPGQLNDLQALNHKVGFWINITELGGVTLTVSGLVPSSTSIPLYAGWNLMGYPTLNNSLSIAETLASTGYTRVEGFNASAPYRIGVLSDNYIMKPGEGYWVQVPADTVWIVDW